MSRVSLDELAGLVVVEQAKRDYRLLSLRRREMILNRYGEEGVYWADNGNRRPQYAYGTMVYVKRMISEDTLFLSALRSAGRCV